MSYQWFREAKYGMMIHRGLYSLLGGEWKETRTSAPYAEWIRSNREVPNCEYEKSANAFYPVFFDVDEIVSFAKSCGMRYLVVTAKQLIYSPKAKEIYAKWWLGEWKGKIISYSMRNSL